LLSVGRGSRVYTV
ncbi:ftsX-like permease family protein, partial [Vibrio parahaemolyticus V-223/04]